MTADSLLHCTRSRGRAAGWGDALERRTHGRGSAASPGAQSGRPGHRDLGSVERAFGRHFFDHGRGRGSKPPEHALIASETPPGG